MRLSSLIACLFIAVVLSLAVFQREQVMALIHPDSAEVPALTERKSVSVKVITEALQVTANDRVFEAIGTGEARQSVDLYPSVTGEVTRVNVQPQAQVSKGQVLVELDSREQKLALSQAEVAVREARNLLSRYEKAVKDGAVPESEVDSARAELETARVTLEQAKLALEHRQIIAPFAGVVGIPAIEAGDRVTATSLISGLDDRNIIHVDFEVPEVLAGRMLRNSGQSRVITATTPALPGERFEATVSALESRLDPQRRTLRVRADIENREDRLRPGMSFTIRWVIAGERYPTVPEIALQWGRDGSYIWAIRDGLAEQVPATVVARTAGRVLVNSELETGEPVVVEGVQRLSPGIAVEIISDNRNE